MARTSAVALTEPVYIKLESEMIFLCDSCWALPLFQLATRRYDYSGSSLFIFTFCIYILGSTFYHQKHDSDTSWILARIHSANIVRPDKTTLKRVRAKSFVFSGAPHQCVAEVCYSNSAISASLFTRCFSHSRHSSY